MFNGYVIKTIPSNAESLEEHGGSKQHFLGQTMAELQAVFQLDAAINTERKNQRFLIFLLSKQASMIRTIRTAISW